MKDVSLYKISSDVIDLMNQIDESGGEISDQQEVLMKTIEHSLTTKTDNIVEWVRSQEDLIELANQKISELTEFKNQITKRIENFDGYVNQCLKMMNKDSIEGNLYQIKKRKPAKVVTITDPNLIPFEFIYRPPAPPATVSKTDIKKALSEGKQVPGAVLEDSSTISISYELKKKSKAKKENTDA